MTRIQELVRYLRESLWFLPALLAVGAIALAAVLLVLDEQLTDAEVALPIIFGGGVDGAREVLSTIATSMLTFTGLVFTITMVVLQSVSNQLSPRVLRTFLRDRGNQFVLGLFVATFLFALIVLRYVRAEGENGAAFVPGISIGAAFGLLLASIGAFIYYIDHMAHAIRASTVIHNIATETRGVLDHLFPEPIGEPDSDSEGDSEPGEEGDRTDHLAADRADRARSAIPAQPAGQLVRARDSGVLVAIDEESLLKAVGRSDGAAPDERFVELVPLVGDYLPEGSVVFRAWGQWDESELAGLQAAIEMGHERMLENDATFGVRQLVDIAVRALSSGINDPTTAVQAIDRIHDILRRLARRRIPSPLRRDPTGQARLYLGRPGWEDYVLLAVEEVRLAGEGQVHVMRRMRQMLLDVLEVAPANRRAALEQAIERVDRSARRGLDDALDRRIARPPDARGQGPMAT